MARKWAVEHSSYRDQRFKDSALPATRQMVAYWIFDQEKQQSRIYNKYDRFWRPVL